MIMTFKSFNINEYRFGFNGMEKDDEFTGTTGAVYDYGFRIYDARIAKFLSVDPLTSDYAFWTPYSFAGDTPIQAIDLDGLEILGYRSMFELRTTKAKQVTYYKIYVLATSTQMKMNSRINSKYFLAGKFMETVYSKTDVVITKPPAIAGSPNTEEVVYDKNLRYINNQMNRNVAGSLSGDINDPGKRGAVAYGYNQRKNKSSAKGGFIADIFIYAMRGLYHYGPLTIEREALEDVQTQIEAYKTATESVERFIGEKARKAMGDKEGTEFLGYVSQYVVDGSLPKNKDDSYLKYVIQHGKDVINSNKKKLNTKKELKSNR